MAQIKWQKRAENELFRYLKNRKKHYRARHIIGRFKLIYYYNETTDTVHIADIWDMRRDPAKLANRIK